jgi:uncharacterized protein
VLYDPDIPVRMAKNKAEYRNAESTTMNHFYEKLFLIKEHLNTQTAKQYATHRHEFMKKFVAEFESEWRFER